MEEAATIARTPRTCFEIWSGDHRQTPGGPAANRGGQVPPQIAQAAVGAPVSNTIHPAAWARRYRCPGAWMARFVRADEDLRGSFLPVFWDIPRANLHAVVDVGAVFDWLRFQFKFSCDVKMWHPIYGGITFSCLWLLHGFTFTW